MTLTSIYTSNRGLVVRGTQYTLSAIHHYTLTAPTTASITKYLTTYTPSVGATTKTLYRTGSSGDTVFDGTYANGTPDFSRNVVITVTHASSVVALSGTITGVDIYNQALTEAWSVTATGTTKTFTGAKGFSRIDTVTVTNAADASADTLKVGTGVVFGLPLKAVHIAPTQELIDGGAATAGVLVAGSAVSTADLRGTYVSNTAPNGTHNWDVWYMTDLPEQSS